MALPKRKRLVGAALASLVRTKPLVYDEYLSIRAVHDAAGGFRCAVIVPAAVAARATQRNRIRRTCTEAVRLAISEQTPTGGWRCIVMVRKTDLPAATELRRRILELLVKSDIVSQ